MLTYKYFGSRIIVILDNILSVSLRIEYYTSCFFMGFSYPVFPITGRRQEAVTAEGGKSMQQTGTKEKVSSDQENIPVINRFMATLYAPREQELYLSAESIEEYIDYLRNRNLRESTLNYCRKSLESLYDELPDCGMEDKKKLDKKSLLNWKNRLFRMDFSWMPINNRISAVNGYLTYKERPDLKMSFLLHPKAELCQPLTREEYRCLLHASKMHVNERLYFLIKILSCTGITLQNLVRLTVELLKGEASLPESDMEQEDFINLPETLKEELLRYAERKNIVTGPVFITQHGTPMDSSNIRKGIRALYRDAGIEKNSIKATDFNMLYYQTFTELQKDMGPLAEPAYDEMLKQEEQIIGWNAGRPYAKYITGERAIH